MQNLINIIDYTSYRLLFKMTIFKELFNFCLVISITKQNSQRKSNLQELTPNSIL